MLHLAQYSVIYERDLGSSDQLLTVPGIKKVQVAPRESERLRQGKHEHQNKNGLD